MFQGQRYFLRKKSLLFWLPNKNYASQKNTSNSSPRFISISWKNEIPPKSKMVRKIPSLKFVHFVPLKFLICLFFPFDLFPVITNSILPSPEFSQTSKTTFSPFFLRHNRSSAKIPRPKPKKKIKEILPSQSPYTPKGTD